MKFDLTPLSKECWRDEMLGSFWIFYTRSQQEGQSFLDG